MTKLLVGITLLTSLSLTSCRAPSEAERMIGDLVRNQNADLISRSLVTFTFRDAAYSMKRNRGRFSYERYFVDSTGAHIRDVLTNDGVSRSVNGAEIRLDSAKARSVTVDVNSVVYFASLPYPLADPGVRARLLDPGIIEGKEYAKLEVTFEPAQGGLDYDDIFVYWINQDTDTIQYMAYYFHTDGGGSRFRKAQNIRRVGGIQFADYINYSSEPDTVRLSVARFDEYFRQGMIKFVSDVPMDSIVVSTNPSDISFR